MARKPIQLRVDPEIADYLSKIAADRHISVSTLVTLWAVDAWADREPEAPPPPPTPVYEPDMVRAFATEADFHASRNGWWVPRFSKGLHPPPLADGSFDLAHPDFQNQPNRARIAAGLEPLPPEEWQRRAGPIASALVEAQRKPEERPKLSLDPPEPVPGEPLMTLNELLDAGI